MRSTGSSATSHSDSGTSVWYSAHHRAAASKRNQSGCRVGLLGLSKWQNNQELFLKKTSEISGLSDFAANEFIQKGNDLEPHVRAIFQIENKQFKVIYKDFDVRINPTHSFIGATLDGEIESKTNKGNFRNQNG